MDAEALEVAVVGQIAALGIPVQPYPQQPGNYSPAAYPGEVLVRYTGTQYSAPDLSGIRMQRIQVLEIVVVSQELRGESGSYAWLDRIRLKLERLCIPGTAGVLELESEEFMDEYNGTWQFGQRWNLKSNYIYGQQDDYADAPLYPGS